MAPDAASSGRPADAGLSEVSRLLHGLNNQLGVILANAELLEHRLGDDANKVRASARISGPSFSASAISSRASSESLSRTQ